MKKWEEINDPKSCWNKAGDDTRVFILVDMDEAAADTIRFWINKRIELGMNKPGDEKLLSAESLANEIESLHSTSDAE